MHGCVVPAPSATTLRRLLSTTIRLSARRMYVVMQGVCARVWCHSSHAQVPESLDAFIHDALHSIVNCDGSKDEARMLEVATSDGDHNNNSNSNNNNNNNNCADFE